MIFFNVNRVHNYYQLPLATILSIFCGAGMTYMRELTNKLTNNKIASMTIIVLVLVYAMGSLSVLKEFYRDDGVGTFIEDGKFIDRSTEKDALLATVTPKDDLWWPKLMYFSDRHGFTLPHKRLNSEMMTYLRSKGIRYFVLVDYENTDGVITGVLEPYKVEAQNDRVMIYDISK